LAVTCRTIFSLVRMDIVPTIHQLDQLVPWVISNLVVAPRVWHLSHHSMAAHVL
jgi:hypothetical protein